MSNRREFLKQAGVLSTVSWSKPSLSPGHPTSPESGATTVLPPKAFTHPAGAVLVMPEPFDEFTMNRTTRSSVAGVYPAPNAAVGDADVTTVLLSEITCETATFRPR